MADAHAAVVQAAEEWVTTVDNAAAWLDVALADDTEAPYVSAAIQQLTLVGARLYIH